MIWQLKTSLETVTITQEGVDMFIIHTDHPSKIDNGLWFPSYQSARRYVKKEMCVEGRFKRIDLIKGDD